MPVSVSACRYPRDVVTAPVLTRRSGRRRRGRPWLPATLIAVAVATSWGITQWPLIVPWSTFVPLAVVAGLFLSMRQMFFVFVVLFLSYLGAALVMWDRKASLWGSALVFVIVIVLMITVARSRARLGVWGNRGESMFVDLRDRLQAQGQLPQLPPGWHAESSIRPAHGDSFSGDFMVSSRSPDGTALELVLVDVSGKGLSAGTRSLLLSGAFAGLLGAMPPAEFLPAANAYLLRQRWDEGFATAVHVAVDLATGAYCVSNAGHPQAVRYRLGSGRWLPLDQERGPVLGVRTDPGYVCVAGQLERGDALLLFTDGVIERRGLDLSVGVDRMLGAAERQVAGGFSGAASRICASSASGEDDDRAVVLVWRA